MRWTSSSSVLSLADNIRADNDGNKSAYATILQASKCGVQPLTHILDIAEFQSDDLDAWLGTFSIALGKFVGRHRAITPSRFLACIVAGLTSWLVDQSLEYCNHRVISGRRLIEQPLANARIAEILLSNQIIGIRLALALNHGKDETLAQADAIPMINEDKNVQVIFEEAINIINKIIELKAGHAFVSPSEDSPILQIILHLFDLHKNSLPLDQAS